MKVYLPNERKIDEDLAAVADSIVHHRRQRSQKAHFKWSILFFLNIAMLPILDSLKLTTREYLW